MTPRFSWGQCEEGLRNRKGRLGCHPKASIWNKQEQRVEDVDRWILTVKADFKTVLFAIEWCFQEVDNYAWRSVAATSRACRDLIRQKHACVAHGLNRFACCFQAIRGQALNRNIRPRNWTCNLPVGRRMQCSIHRHGQGARISFRRDKDDSSTYETWERRWRKSTTEWLPFDMKKPFETQTLDGTIASELCSWGPERGLEETGGVEVMLWFTMSCSQQDQVGESQLSNRMSSFHR